MKVFLWPIFAVLFGWHICWARNGMTIDKLECTGNAVCTDAHCPLNVATNNPFESSFSFDCNLKKTCTSVFVRVKNYAKPSKVYTLNLDVKVDVCAITAGAKHPIIQTFLGSSVYENLDKHLLVCPWGPGMFKVDNFTVDGTANRGGFGPKKIGRYRAELEFTCGQNLQLFTMKFHGKRNFSIPD